MLYIYFFFFFNDTATTEIYTLSLHDALPISSQRGLWLTQVTRSTFWLIAIPIAGVSIATFGVLGTMVRSEEHTSELQSRLHLVCRLLLEKKKKQELLTA